MASGTSDLFDKWFRIADVDRDGKISGGEAVTFFQRSGLSQDTLFTIWKLVAGDAAFLTKPQFWASLRLVSLAQRHNGSLPEAEARRTLIGLEATPLPPPSLSGLENHTASAESRAAVASSPELSLPTSSPYPPLQPQTLQHYLQLFQQLDLDRDGYVQGGDCFGTFMHWGLPKQTLRNVWQVVAGNASALDRQNFVACLYLMDLAKQGKAVPNQLPPGPFPPGYSTGAATPGLPTSNASSAVDLSSMQQVQHDVFSNDLPVPVLPQRTRFTPPASARRPSSLPAQDPQRLAGLDPQQQQRLEAERQEAAEKESAAHKAQEEAAAAAAKEQTFRAALEELTLFKSRMAASLLQAQEQLQAANSQAEEMETTYQTAWTTSQASQTQSTALLEQLSQAKATKAEAKRKLEDLKKDISSLESITEEQVRAEGDPIPALLQEVATLQAQKEQLVLRQSLLNETHTDLDERVSQLKEDITGASSSITLLEENLDVLVKQLEGGDDSAALELQTWLRRTAAAHQKLVNLARKEKITVPELEEEDDEASQADGKDTIVWSDYILLGAKDWDDSTPLDVEMVDELPSSSRMVDPTALGPPRQTQEEDLPDAKNSLQVVQEPVDGDSWAAF